MRKIALAFILIFSAVFCAAEEFISSYGVELVLGKDGTATITETIAANAEHKNINRGLYRDMPYNFNAGYGLKKATEYKIISLTRNGKTEPYFTENKNDSLRVNFGNDDLIPTGPNTYVFKYTAANAAGFFKDYDEIYWNAIGPDWNFRIADASYTLTLPPEAEVIKDKISVYYGPKGSKQTPDFTMTNDAPGVYRFVLRENLNPREAFTVAVPFKKGLLTPPTKEEIAKMYFFSNFKFAALPLWVAVVFAYFFIVWAKYGRDKRIKPMYAVYDPPKDMTPAMAQFLWTTGGGGGASYLSLFIISFAVKKCLKIEKETTFLFSSYTLTPLTENIAALDEKEREVFGELFASGKIKLSGSYNSSLAQVTDELETAIQKEGKQYITANKKYFGIGFFLTMLFFFITGWISFGNPIIPLVLSAFYSMFIFMNVMVVGAAAKAFISKSGSKLSLLGALGLTLFMLLHSGAFFTISAGSLAFTALYCLCYIALMIICGVFKVLMPSFTYEGRALLGDLTAFKEYLDVGEFGRIAASSPEAQAEVFCKYYAYAVAFDMESKWNKHFENILGAASAQAVVDEHGLGVMRGAGGAFMTGALMGAVSSTSTPPSSSGGGGWSGGSGSGGGGSSGGGGGGGGGGGR